MASFGKNVARLGDLHVCLGLSWFTALLSLFLLSVPQLLEVFSTGISILRPLGLSSICAPLPLTMEISAWTGHRAHVLVISVARGTP